MRLKFEIENDVSVLRDKKYGYDFYLDSFLEVVVHDKDSKFSLFSTTMHSTIIITFTELLIELHKTGRKQTFDPFGNANVYTLERIRKDLKITNFSALDDQVEYVHVLNFTDFTNAYLKEIERYLKAMIAVEANIAEHQDYVLLFERLNMLKDLSREKE